MIITLPSILLENKIYRYNNTISMVVDYYKIKEDIKILEVVKVLKRQSYLYIRRKDEKYTLSVLGIKGLQLESIYINSIL